ncbi:MAG: division/cell wall cluster transcriptional repressor MraZ [Mycobacteriales bacterium]
MPKSFRATLAGGVVVTRGHDRCLYIYPAEAFARVSRQLADVPLADRAGRRLVRMFCSAAERRRLDRRGRLHLSPQLRSYAQLAGPQCVVVGVSGRLEVWDAGRWAGYRGESEGRYQLTS